MSIADSLLARLRAAETWWQRDEIISKIAQDYGEGFANVMRGQINIDKQQQARKDS